jgi:hypothetical protein
MTKGAGVASGARDRSIGGYFFTRLIEQLHCRRSFVVEATPHNPFAARLDQKLVPPRAARKSLSTTSLVIALPPSIPCAASPRASTPRSHTIMATINRHRLHT